MPDPRAAPHLSGRARPPSRRRVLSLIGVAGAVALAGCSGGSGDAVETSGGDETESESDEVGGDGPDAAAVDCGAFDGSPTAFDPGDEPWIFTFDYPDTWEPRESAFDDAEGAVSADIGHVGTSTDGEFHVNLRVDQITVPRNREFVDEWIDSGNFEVAETLDYDGEPLAVATGHVTPEDTVYRGALPVRGAADTFQQVSMRAWTTEDYLDCSDAVFDVAWETFTSIRPAPANG